jgi:hypothetical protein
VDRAEFLMGMLVAMDCASERDCAALLARFDELDTDGCAAAAAAAEAAPG